MCIYAAGVGHRASYVIIERGVTQMFWSRWGGQRIIADLLIGPGAITAIRTANGGQPPADGDNVAALLWNGPDPSQDLLSDSACEGAALIDYDQRALLAYQWHDNYVEFAEGCARLVAAWPGWQVRWAFHGIGDLAGYLGRDRSSARRQESLTGQPAGVRQVSLLRLRHVRRVRFLRLRPQRATR